MIISDCTAAATADSELVAQETFAEKMTAGNAVLDRLDQLSIDHDVYHEHGPLFTVEDVTRYKSCIPGLSDKNLFLKDKKGKRFFVVLVSEDKCVDLPALAKLLDVGHLSMASLERMTAVLGVTGGAVSPLAVVDDHAGKVRVIDDR
ncbi:unnamed protein product (mitochondrion) [Plasmodiophora brassicae]|uniref:YbaK/aminoacyl-tRNA synthetase-associated domain-containing protein n=1 Tax=Plasmodiophora brassicae TaxID=37360 RepID=A0A3P3Y835_PLABS|nr:unnamed protein product [Plasmodiophora brassicae]